MFRYFFLLALLILPTIVSAQTLTSDLGFKNQGDIFFSTDNIVSGETVRVYARIRNYGIEDVDGYVSFHQGTIAIGDSQVVSVRANGEDDEVYVDFVVPEGAFNIRAEIKGTDPADQNSSNDVVISQLFVPLQDDDGDGIFNNDDNCPTIANAAQTDSDGDGMGNACDDDNDNDGISNDVEREIGTDPLNSDTDGDGIPDNLDDTPTGEAADAPQDVNDVADNETTDVSFDAADSDSGDTDESIGGLEDGDTENADDEVSNGSAERTGLQISPNATFGYEQINWNTYKFEVRGFDGAGYRYEWDFGDGVTSSRDLVDHSYRKFGDYTVSLTVTDPDGNQSKDSSKISVSFFNFENPFLKILLGGLLILFLISLGVLARSMKKAKGIVAAIPKKKKEIEGEDGMEEALPEESEEEEAEGAVVTFYEDDLAESGTEDVSSEEPELEVAKEEVIEEPEEELKEVKTGELSDDEITTAPAVAAIKKTKKKAPIERTLKNASKSKKTATTKPKKGAKKKG